MVRSGQTARLAATGLLLAAVSASGCSEAVVRQYTKLGKWTRPADTPQVLSGSPSGDQAAFDASEEALSEADWKLLEQIAPRPVWERIGALREKLLGKAPGARSTTTAPAPATRPVAARKVDIADRVTVTALPDGKIRIFCRLRHYGGVRAISTRDGGTDRRKILVRPADLAPAADLVNKQLAGKGTCTALPGQNALVVTCAADARQTVLGMLGEIDTPRRQVEISARIFEVSHEFDFQFGANAVLEHIASDNTQQLVSRFSTRSFLESLSTPALGAHAYQGSALRLMQMFGDSGISMDVTFQALAETGFLREVASPRMTVMVGRTGYMLAGQELPILSARIANDQLVTEKTTYKPVGVQLYITPQAADADAVRMHVVTIVSAIAGFSPRMTMDQTEKLQGLLNPIIESREAETSVVVPSGSTLVIGGLRMVRHLTRERKIPGLGDIKLVEWLFKKHRSQRQINDLYFFVTPRIVP